MGRLILAVLMMASVIGAQQSRPSVSSIGIYQLKPDGEAQYFELSSDSSYCSGFRPIGGPPQFADGYIIGEKAGPNESLELASKVYFGTDPSETAAIDFGKLIFSTTDRNKLIVVIRMSDGKSKQFVREFNAGFESPELKQLDSLLQAYLRK